VAVFIAEVGLEGDAVGDAEEQYVGRQGVIAALGNQDKVGAKVPGLPLKIDPGLEVTDKINVDTTIVGEGAALIAGVAGDRRHRVGDLADAGEEAEIGVKVVPEVCLSTKTDEVGALINDRAVGVIDSHFDRWSDGKPEVTSEFDTEDAAVVVCGAEVGSGVERGDAWEHGG